MINPSIVEKKSSPLGSILGGIVGAVATLFTGGAAAAANPVTAALGSTAGKVAGKAMEAAGNISTGSGVGSLAQNAVVPAHGPAQGLAPMARRIGKTDYAPSPILEQEMAAHKRRLGY